MHLGICKSDSVAISLLPWRTIYCFCSGVKNWPKIRGWLWYRMGNLCHIKFWRWGWEEMQPAEDKESGGEWNIDRRQLIKKKKKTQQYKGEPPSTILQVTWCERRNNAHWSVFLWEELGHTRTLTTRVSFTRHVAYRRVKNLSHIQILPNYPDITFAVAVACFSCLKTGGRHKSRQRPWQERCSWWSLEGSTAERHPASLSGLPSPPQ